MAAPTSKQVAGIQRPGRYTNATEGAIGNRVFEGRDVHGQVFYGRGYGSVPNSYEVAAPQGWTGIRIGTDPDADPALEPHFISFFTHGSLGAVMTDITDLVGGQPHPNLFTFAPVVASGGVFDGAPYGVLGLPGPREWFLYSAGIQLSGPFYDSNAFSGNAGQVLASLGGTNGVDWIDLPTPPTPGVPEGYYQAIVLTSNATVSSTAFVDAGDLHLELVENAIWTFDFFLIVDINSSSDFKLRFTVPTGAGGGFQVLGHPLTNTMAGTDLEAGGGSFAAEPVYNVGSSTQYLMFGKGIAVNGVNAGDLQLQIALNSGTSTATVLPGSYIRGLRIS